MVRRRVFVLAAGVTLALTLAPMVAAQAERGFDFVDTASFPTVQVVVTPPPGLGTVDPRAVHVIQDGEPLSASIVPLGSEPVELVLLIDTSGSMTGAPIEAAKTAAIAFIEGLPPGSEIAVLGFGDDVAVLTPLTASRADAESAIEAIQARGETSLNDAVIAAVDTVTTGRLDRQFIVLLSDGGDTVSTATLDDVTNALATVPVGFYAIALEGSEPDPQALAAMAQTTGGTVVPASDSSALASVYDEIAREVVSQYEITFAARNGGDTHLEVSIGDTPDAHYAADLTFPTLPETATTTIPVFVFGTTTLAGLTPPVTTVFDPPGFLERPWALTVGIISIGLVLALAFAYVLAPSPDTPARTSLAMEEPGRAGPFGRLSRIASRAQAPIRRVLGPTRSRGLDAALDAAGIALRAGEFYTMVVVLALVGAAIGLLVRSPMLGVLLLAGAIVLPRLWVSRAAARRRTAFADQLEGTLQLIAGSMRAGYGLTQAMATVAEESPAPTSDEFARVVIESRVGRELTASLDAVADRMRNVDFTWVTDAVSIQQSVGGNLAEVLDAVAATIRDRNQIRRQVQALSAEGRMSAAILIALPFVIAGVISIINPGYLDPLFSTVIGRVLLAVGGVAVVLGILWIRRIVKLVF
jgi:tight adherence protein B